VHPDRTVVGWNRHREQHRAWGFTGETAAIFHAIPGRDWYVFNGELLHSKTKHIKNTHVLYDVLVADGIHLTGTTYEFRYQLLFDILAKGLTFAAPGDDDHFELDRYTRIARNYTSGFTDLFASLVNPEDEGLVLRKPDVPYLGSNADSWMVKFRRPGITKLY
jgi:ATP-dependent DNA ligase